MNIQSTLFSPINQITYSPNPVEGAPLGTVAVGVGLLVGEVVCARAPCKRRSAKTKTLTTKIDILSTKDTSSLLPL